MTWSYGNGQILVPMKPFFHIFGGHKSFLWGHWYPCFGLLVKSPLVFKARVGSLIHTWWRQTCYTFPKSHLWFDTAELLAASMAAKPSHSLACTWKQTLVGLKTRTYRATAHSATPGKRSTDLATPTRLGANETFEVQWSVTWWAPNSMRDAWRRLPDSSIARSCTLHDSSSTGRGPSNKPCKTRSMTFIHYVCRFVRLETSATWVDGFHFSRQTKFPDFSSIFECFVVVVVVVVFSN